MLSRPTNGVPTFVRPFRMPVVSATANPVLALAKRHTRSRSRSRFTSTPPGTHSATSPPSVPALPSATRYVKVSEPV